MYWASGEEQHVLEHNDYEELRRDVDLRLDELSAVLSCLLAERGWGRLIKGMVFCCIGISCGYLMSGLLIKMTPKKMLSMEITSGIPLRSISSHSRSQH